MRKKDLLKDKTDMGEELVWIPVNQIADKRIKPTFITERIYEIISSTNTIQLIIDIIIIVAVLLLSYVMTRTKTRS